MTLPPLDILGRGDLDLRRSRLGASIWDTGTVLVFGFLDLPEFLPRVAEAPMILCLDEKVWRVLLCWSTFPLLKDEDAGDRVTETPGSEFRDLQLPLSFLPPWPRLPPPLGTHDDIARGVYALKSGGIVASDAEVEPSHRAETRQAVVVDAVGDIQFHGLAAKIRLSQRVHLAHALDVRLAPGGIAGPRTADGRRLQEPRLPFCERADHVALRDTHPGTRDDVVDL